MPMSGARKQQASPTDPAAHSPDAADTPGSAASPDRGADAGRDAGAAASATTHDASSSQLSPPALSGDASADGNNNKRKRGASHRGVAHLTAEQLARKRANDREAQRAIRERTRNHIDRLNAEIRELKSQQPYQDLQGALRQKEAVEAENKELKRRIAGFIEGVQAFLGGGGATQRLDELAAVATSNTVVSQPHHSESIQINSPYTADAASTQSWTPNNGYEQSPQSIHPELATSLGSSDERLGVNYLLHGPQPQHRRSPGSTSSDPGPGHDRSHHSAYSTLPRWLSATCPFDLLMMDFLRERQRMAADGAPKAVVVGPAYPNFNALMNKNTRSSSHPLSKIMTDVCGTFPDIAGMPEQVAVVYIMFLVMRWFAEPTRENYERLPEWMTPRPSQLFTAHPHWLDYLPWPSLRDITVHHCPVPDLNNFFIPYTTTLSLNWPYEPIDVLLETPSHESSPGKPQEPLYILNPAFESHLRKLENWSLGPAFGEAFPMWASCVRIKRPDGGRS